MSATPTAYAAVVPGQQEGGRPPEGASCLTLYIASTVETDVTLGIKVVCPGGTVLQFDRDDLPIDALTVNTISEINYIFDACSVGEKATTPRWRKSGSVRRKSPRFGYTR